MTINEWNTAAFQDYAKPLEKLEKSFNEAGLPLAFHALVDPFGNKMIRVMSVNPNNKIIRNSKIICIEGDSPAQAVKDVAAGVRL